MNKHEIYIVFMSLVHTSIWVFLLFSGLLSCNMARTNLLYLIPLIYLVQTIFPTHIVTTHKVNYIRTHMKDLTFDKDIQLLDMEIQDIKHFAVNEGVSLQDTAKCFKVLKYYENKTIIPYFVDRARKLFENAFQNPFTAQGFVILAFIINSIIYIKKRC
jgi:hypothetical protein